MSDRALYADKPTLQDGLHSHLTDGLNGPCVACGAVNRWVVKVEPCVHGNYARHLLPQQEEHFHTGTPCRLCVWCDGTPETTDE